LEGVSVISSIWRINIASMLFFTLVQLVVPLIPQYAVDIGAAPILLGFAVACVSITAIFLRPAFGVLSDKGSRTKFMLLGLLLASAAYALLFFSQNIYWIMVARLIEGAGVAAFVPSSIASAVDSAPPGKLGETLGWRSLMIGLGFSIGPALSGVIAQLIGFVGTFGLAAFFLLFLIPLVIVKDPKRSVQKKTSWEGLAERNFLLAFFGVIMYAIAWMGLLTFLTALLTELNYSPLQITIFVSIEAVSSLALRILAGRAADRNPRALTYGGLLIISFSFFLVYMFEVPPLLYVAAVIFGLGIGIYIPGSQTLALTNAPLHSRGLLSSIYTMGNDVGMLIGPTAFGIIIQLSGSYQDAFALAPILPFIAALVIFAPSLLSKIRPKS
jgi:MFS family permease